jgi:hypothetical protein
MRTAIDILAYIERIAGAHRLIKSYHEEDWSELYDSERPSVDYPALYAETPEFSIQGDNDASRPTFRGSLIIITASNPRELATIRQAKAITEQIARSIVQRILKDTKALRISKRTFRVVPVMSLSHDGSRGWRINYELQLTSLGTLDDFFPSDYDATAHLSFTWLRNADGDIEYNVEERPSSGDITVTARHDGGVAGEVQSPITPTGDHLVVQMETSYGGHQYSASAYIQPTDRVGRSVPYLYDPYNL